MKTARILPALLFMFLVFVLIQPVYAGQKTITIPKGTKVEKIGDGNFRFILPNKKIVELKEFNTKTGMAGSVEVIDPEPPLKPVTGKQGMLNIKKLSHKKAVKLPKSDYVQIDDDITWLPITLTFQVTGMIDPTPPGKPGALSPQPDPPGKK